MARSLSLRRKNEVLAAKTEKQIDNNEFTTIRMRTITTTSTYVQDIHIFMYIYQYIYTDEFIHISTHIYTYIHMYVYIHTYMKQREVLRPGPGSPP